MMYEAKAAVCFEIRIKHSKQSEHHVEFWMLNLVVCKETAKFWKVKPIRGLTLAPRKAQQSKTHEP